MKILFLFLLLSLTSVVYAQEKFIEVTVSDTVLVKAQLLIYKLSMSYDDLFRDFVDTGNNADQAKAFEQREKSVHGHFDSLLSAIKQKGYTILPLSVEDSFFIEAHGLKIYSRRILVHSVDSLSHLYQLLKNEKHITAFVDLEMAPDEQAYQKTLYKKLIASATTRATSIAVYANRQLGKIISIQEKPSEKTTGGWTSYPPLGALGDSSIPGWHTTTYASNLTVLNTAAPINDLYLIGNTLVVRFAIE